MYMNFYMIIVLTLVLFASDNLESLILNPSSINSLDIDFHFFNLPLSSYCSSSLQSSCLSLDVNGLFNHFSSSSISLDI